MSLSLCFPVVGKSGEFSAYLAVFCWNLSEGPNILKLSFFLHTLPAGRVLDTISFKNQIMALFSYAYHPRNIHSASSTVIDFLPFGRK